MPKPLKFTILILFLSLFSFLSASTVYVKSNATGANTGVDWTNAYTDLASALNSTFSGNNVWVAAGNVYKPTATADQTISFWSTRELR